MAVLPPPAAAQLLPPPHCVASSPSLSLPPSLAFLGLPSRDGRGGGSYRESQQYNFSASSNFQANPSNFSKTIYISYLMIEKDSRGHPVFPQAVIVGGSLALVVLFFSRHSLSFPPSPSPLLRGELG